MKKIFMILASLGLASCDGVHDLQNAERAVHPSVTQAHRIATSGATSVITDRSVPAYSADLMRCENRVAASMGPPGLDDSTEALKRALDEHPGEKTITLSYVNQDKAISRQSSIHRCLSHLGYLVE